MEQQALRKKKFLMVLPVMILPFLILLFYSLGGGKGKERKEVEKQGLNTTVPSAQLENGPLDKLSIYQQAEKDSLKRANQLRNDPFLSGQQSDDLLDRYTSKSENPYGKNRQSTSLPSYPDRYEDPNEEKVRKKLAELEQTLTKSNEDVLEKYSKSTPDTPEVSANTDAALSRLYKAYRADSNRSDPEIDQLNSMLEKVLDIQHPERVTEKLKSLSSKQNTGIVPVQTTLEENNISLIGTSANIADTTTPLGRYEYYRLFQSPSINRFYELDDEMPATEANNAIAAVIHESQTVVSGATVKIRLEQDVFLQGQLIPAGTFVYGNCSLDGDRLKITVNDIHYQKAIYPVGLTLFDGVDGMEGIYIPGAITRDAAKKGTEDALQNWQLTTLNPSMTAQAASAGIEAVRNLLSKKAKLVRVTLKADHPILLKATHS